MRHTIIWTVAALLLTWVGAVVSAAELTPESILAHADQARGDLDGGIQWRIRVESVQNNRTTNRTLQLKADAGRHLAEFLAPARVKGRQLLMVDRNMWFLKPGLRKPVPLSPRQRLLGQASYGDLASTRYSKDYEVRSVEQEDLDGELCYVFDLSAANKRATYDRIRYWISADRLVGVKSQFFTSSGKMFKSARFEYDNQVRVDGVPRSFISRMIITDAVIADDFTTLAYDKIKVAAVPDATFNLNLLRR